MKKLLKLAYKLINKMVEFGEKENPLIINEKPLLTSNKSLFDLHYGQIVN